MSTERVDDMLPRPRLLLLAALLCFVAAAFVADAGGSRLLETRASEAATFQDLSGVWDWVDTTSVGDEFAGIATIDPMMGGFSWGWADQAGGRWGAPICYAGGGCPTWPSISGDSITIPGYTNDRALTATWSGTISASADEITGTWSQSDGQFGTFVATKIIGAMAVRSDGGWKFSRSIESGWQQPSYDDSSWGNTIGDSAGACGSYPGLMWAPNPVSGETIVVRRTVELANAPARAIYVGGFDDDGLVYVNGTLVHTDDDNWSTGMRTVDITGLLHAGPNVFAMQASDDLGGCQSIYARFAMSAAGLAKIGTGAYHTCALTAVGGVKCWGQNLEGQLGDGTNTGRLTPVDVVGLNSGVADIVVSAVQACALMNSGTVKCWGNNDNGSLGDGTTTDRNTPVDVAGLTNVVALGAGYQHTCAVVSGGALKCWGWNGFGQVGNGSSDWQPHSTPEQVVGLGSNVVAVDGGEAHTCALMSGGGVKCWGRDDSGQVGATTTQSCRSGGPCSMTPLDVVGLTSGVTAIGTGTNHSCAVTSPGGVVKCWGYNAYGQLGDETTTSREEPVDVLNLSGISAVSGGAFHTCTLSSAGGVKCWGRNNIGQLGDGTTTDRMMPAYVSELTSGVAQSDSSYEHNCALTGTGARCWGKNTDGQLGDGTTTNRSVPVAVCWTCGTPPSHRKVIFIQGYNSGTYANDATCTDDIGFPQDDDPTKPDRAGELRTYLSGAGEGSWVPQRGVRLNAEDFVYFSYAFPTESNSGYCGTDGYKSQRPKYTDADSCTSIDPIAAEPGTGARLGALVAQLVAQDPAVQIDVISHSQGGLVSLYWLTSSAAAPLRSHIHSVVTVDGFPSGNATPQTLLASAFCSDVLGATDLLKHYSPSDWLESSSVVAQARYAPQYARIYTLRDVNTGLQLDPVPDDNGTFKRTRSTCPDEVGGDSNADGRGRLCQDVVDFYEEMGDHSTAWTSPGKSELEMIGCAITDATFCYSQYQDSIPLQPLETKTALASVGAGNQTASFRAEWQGSTVSLTLKTPGGATVDANTPGVVHYVTATSEVYDVEAPEPGTWELQLYGADLPPGGETVLAEVATTPLPPPDVDQDSVPDSTDNCPLAPNWDQTDTDSDGLGDDCDADMDNDSVLNAQDNCATAANADQTNTDGNFIDLHVFGKLFDDITVVNSDNEGDACDPDIDNDGIANDVEAEVGPGGSAHAQCTGATGPTDPLLSDTDDDMVLDGAECAMGTDPANAASRPPAAPAGDADHDGLTDAFEATIGTNPALPNTDGDRLLDSVEFKGYQSNPLVIDTDGDGCPDGREAASVNEDVKVNSLDMVAVATHFGPRTSGKYIKNFDVNKDGNINSIDMLIQAKLFTSLPC